MLVGMAADATGVVERAGHVIVWQEFGAGEEALLLRVPAAVFIAANVSLAPGHPVRVSADHYARRLACPSLVIHGDADGITPLGRGEELAKLAGSELIVLPGSGHEPQCRIPDVVNSHMEAFLQSALNPGEI